MRLFLRSIYKSVIEGIPSPAKPILAHIEHKIASSPRIFYDRKVHPPGKLPRGAVTISIDFELSWAWQYARIQAESFVAKGMREREQVPLLLAGFAQYGVPVTWATVGHLFLHRCSRGVGGLAHAELPRLLPFETANWKFSGGDWYQHDPCTDLARDPSWYAPDLIERILSSRVGHEIACHSFSHAGFGSYCPENVAAAELEACREAMAPFGLKPTTWVFPGSDKGNFKTLAANGVRIVRDFPRRGAEITLPTRRDDGMWAVHASSCLSRGKFWSIEQRLARLKRFVDAAASTNLAAHIWFHPSLPAEEIRSLLQPFLAYCAKKRDSGVLDLFTMEQLVCATERAGRS